MCRQLRLISALTFDTSAGRRHEILTESFEFVVNGRTVVVDAPTDLPVLWVPAGPTGTNRNEVRVRYHPMRRVLRPMGFASSSLLRACYFRLSRTCGLPTLSAVRLRRQLSTQRSARALTGACIPSCDSPMFPIRSRSTSSTVRSCRFSDPRRRPKARAPRHSLMPLLMPSERVNAAVGAM